MQKVNLKATGQAALVAVKAILKLADKAVKKREPEAPKVHRTHKLDSAGWLESGRWVNVSSSNVHSIRYDQAMAILFVRFQNDQGGPGAEYAYYNVPRRIAKGMFNAGSMGKYVWSHLRDKYSYARLN
jgi:hypothetical protein